MSDACAGCGGDGAIGRPCGVCGAGVGVKPLPTLLGKPTVRKARKTITGLDGPVHPNAEPLEGEALQEFMAEMGGPSE